MRGPTGSNLATGEGWPYAGIAAEAPLESSHADLPVMWRGHRRGHAR